MQFLSNIGSAVGRFFGSDVGKQLGSTALDYASRKIEGIPTPEHVSGPEAGVDYRGFMNEAYPGTTPWERLGASGGPSSAVVSENMKNKAQFRMQSQELNNRREVADQTNRAHVIAAAANGGPSSIMGVLDALYKKPVRHFDSQGQQARERLDKDLPNIDAGTKEKLAAAASAEAHAKLTGNENELARVRAQNAKLLVNAEVAHAYSRILSDLVGSVSSGFNAMNLGRFASSRGADFALRKFVGFRQSGKAVKAYKVRRP